MLIVSEKDVEVVGNMLRTLYNLKIMSNVSEAWSYHHFLKYCIEKVESLNDKGW